MSFQTINVGTTPGDGTGDPARTAGQKINSNFALLKGGATTDTPTSGDASTSQLVVGNDSRLTDARTPTTHASSHASGGSDPVAVASTQISDATSAGKAILTAASAAAQTALLSNVSGDSGSGGTKGLVPAPAAGDAAAGRYLKADGTWTVPPGGTGGSPGGSSGQIQWNNGGAFGGFTVGGDGTLNTSTGAITITKTNGGAFGSLATLSSVNNANWSGTALSIVNGGTGQTSASAAFNALSPMTTAGDLLYGGVSGAGTRLGIGSTGQVLTVSGGVPAWGNLADVFIDDTNYNLVIGNSNFKNTVSQAGGGLNGLGNVGVGQKALNAMTTGSTNTALGYLAGQLLTTAAGNTMIGEGAMWQSTGGINNVAIGIEAMGDGGSTGNHNVAIGSVALRNSTTGSYNAACGDGAGYSITTGNGNTYVGLQAGYSNSTGSYNTILGYNAGEFVSGSTNIVIGSQSGSTLTSGGSNILIGGDVVNASDSFKLNIGGLIQGDLSGQYVGIGMASNGADRLAVAGTVSLTGSQIKFNNTGSSYITYGQSWGNGDFSFRNGATTILDISATTGYTFSMSPINFAAGNNTTIGTTTNYDLIFQTNSLEHLRITKNGLLTFGGATSSYPALKPSSGVLAVRLADDSAAGPLSASSLALGGATIGTNALAVTGGFQLNGTSVGPLLTGLGGPSTQNANYTFVASDVGKMLRHTDASNYTWTLDTYANQPIAAGQIIYGTCESTGTLTIAAPSGGTLIRIDGTAGTGNRTVGAASEFVLKKLDGANAWAISGSALS